MEGGLRRAKEEKGKVCIWKKGKKRGGKGQKRGERRKGRGENYRKEWEGGASEGKGEGRIRKRGRDE